MTDSIALVPQKKWFTKPYREMLVRNPEPDKTGEEIVSDILKRLKA